MLYKGIKNRNGVKKISWHSRTLSVATPLPVKGWTSPTEHMRQRFESRWIDNWRNCSKIFTGYRLSFSHLDAPLTMDLKEFNMEINLVIIDIIHKRLQMQWLSHKTWSNYDSISPLHSNWLLLLPAKKKLTVILDFTYPSNIFVTCQKEDAQFNFFSSFFSITNNFFTISFHINMLFNKHEGSRKWMRIYSGISDSHQRGFWGYYTAFWQSWDTNKKKITSAITL
jgi:hypothetical protein